MGFGGCAGLVRGGGLWGGYVHWALSKVVWKHRRYFSADLLATVCAVSLKTVQGVVFPALASVELGFHHS